MSFLAFNVDDTGILVVTDTIVYAPSGETLGFTNKCVPLPHLRMAVAVTGALDLAVGWVATLNLLRDAADIDEVATFAPTVLAAAWDELESAMTSTQTSTVYHFGVTRDGEHCWYAFRSTAGFAAERYDGGFAVKPGTAAMKAAGSPGPVMSVDELVVHATEVKAELHAEPVDDAERLLIGGELWATVLNEGTTWCTQLVHTFPDYEEQWTAVRQAHARNRDLRARLTRNEGQAGRGSPTLVS